MKCHSMKEKMSEAFQDAERINAKIRYFSIENHWEVFTDEVLRAQDIWEYFSTWCDGEVVHQIFLHADDGAPDIHDYATEEEYDEAWSDYSSNNYVGTWEIIFTNAAGKEFCYNSYGELEYEGE